MKNGHDQKVDTIIDVLLDQKWLVYSNNYSNWHLIRIPSDHNLFTDISTSVVTLCGKRLQKAPKLGATPDHGHGIFNVRTPEEWTISPPMNTNGCCSKCAAISEKVGYSDIAWRENQDNDEYIFYNKDTGVSILTPESI
jgi:hypothetical protein